MDRRGFITLVPKLAAGAVAAKIGISEAAGISNTVGGISRATFEWKKMSESFFVQKAQDDYDISEIERLSYDWWWRSSGPNTPGGLDALISVR